jgi:hypothetical protein
LSKTDAPATRRLMSRPEAGLATTPTLTRRPGVVEGVGTSSISVFVGRSRETVAL